MTKTLKPRKKRLTRREIALGAAQEALKQLRTGHIVAEAFNTYYEPRVPTEFTFIDSKEESQKFVKNTPCKACALGALFVGKVIKFNNFCFSAHGGVRSYMVSILGPRQAELIESAFEVIEARSLRSAEQHLTSILKNIIKNKGVFVPLK